MIQKITHKDPSKRSKNEPFAGIKYNGSYNSAANVLAMIGINNLAVKASAITDELIESLMDNDSNLTLPEIISNASEKIHGSRSMKLKVDWWLVMLVDDGEYTEFVTMPDQEFKAHYCVC